MILEWLKPKVFGKREENGGSTSHVLSTRRYAHIRVKHDKKGHLVKTCHFTPFKSLMQIKQVIPTNQTFLLTQTSNM